MYSFIRPLFSVIILITGSLVASLASGPLLADELIIPVGKQGSEKSSLATPDKGLLMVQVEEQFGAPLQKSAMIGEPPISNWEYPEYRVYFESDHVIHTVLKPYIENAQTENQVAKPEATE